MGKLLNNAITLPHQSRITGFMFVTPGKRVNNKNESEMEGDILLLHFIRFSPLISPISPKSQSTSAEREVLFSPEAAEVGLEYMG